MEENFEELLNQSLSEKKLGKTVTGKVIRITKQNEIFVDIGYKADGIIPYSEYTKEEGKDPRIQFKPGDEITADVLKLNDGLGNVLLSYRRAKTRTERKELENKIKNKEVFCEKVTDVTEKGLITAFKGIRIFIPLSLSGIEKGENIQDYKGKEVRFIIKEYERDGNRVIGSVRSIKDKERKEKQEEFWKNVEIGKKYEGIVKSISSYGAFVELCEGVQGLLHVSDISWERNANPRELLEQEQKIPVTIKELEKENKRIKLEFDKKGPNPWEKVKEKYHVNDVVEVTIVKFMPFGAFAELEKGIEGLIHVSQITQEHITKPEDKLSLGQKICAKILNIDFENKKIELSIRELEGTSYDSNYAEELKNANIIKGEE